MTNIITNTCRAIVKRGTPAPPMNATHGGKRPGAGRPATTVKPKRDQSDMRSIRIPTHEWDIIKAVAAANGVTTSAFIRDAAYNAAAPADLYPRHEDISNSEEVKNHGI